MESLFILGHFELRISKTDERLLIEAENQQTSETLSKQITDDMAKGLSKDSFFDMQTIYQVLTDYFTNKPPSVSVSLSDEGKLAYSYQFLMGSVVKEVGFTIQLEKQETDPLKSMEKTIQKLNQRISELEEQVKKQPSQSPGEGNLEKMMDQQLKDFERRMLQRMDQRFAEMDKKIELLSHEKKKEVKSHEGKELNPKSAKIKPIIYKFPNVFAGFMPYSITNQNKTATRTHSMPSTYDVLLPEKPIPTDYDTKFSIYISNNDTKQLGIGLTNMMPSASGYSKLGEEKFFKDFFQYQTYYVYMSDGSSWKNGSQKSLNLPVPQNGDTFTFTFKAASRELTIYQNDKEVDSHTLNKGDIYTNPLYPFICGTGDAGPSFSFC